MQEETVYEKSERLFQEALDSMTDEEFLQLYDSVEWFQGPTIDEFISWMPVNQSPLSDFVHNKTDEDRGAIYDYVIENACEIQNEVIEKVK